MKVLITGAKGFVGKNLRLSLTQKEGIEFQLCDIDTPKEELLSYLESCDFVVHLAGVNRPKEISEFEKGNKVFTEDILAILAPRAVPLLLASSTQAALDNDYGRSKKAAEEAVFAYAKETGAKVYVYRFSNIFGKWALPNYNSAVATWCHNIAHELPIFVRDKSAQVTLIYIDDVVDAIISALSGKLAPKMGEILSVTPAYTHTLGEITELLQSFRNEPQTLQIPDQYDDFTKKLYATYLSYLPDNKFSYPLTMHIDSRGSFTEILHTKERGQVSVNISKPEITKGEHWHHTKHEKFCVVSGKGLIQFRKMDDENAPIINYHVSGEKICVVSIPPGYVHNIKNEGDTELVTIMWANEIFDKEHPDTFRDKVDRNE